jgi:hypothetical protein
MATKMLVCPECASAIAPGRFACTSCGALLASVATAPRTLGWVDAPSPPTLMPAAPERVDEPPIAADATEPATAEAAEPMQTIGPGWAHGPLERAPGETDLDLLDEDAPLALEDASASATATAAAVAAVADVEPDPPVESETEAITDDAADEPVAVAPGAAKGPAWLSAIAHPAVEDPSPERNGLDHEGDPRWPEHRGWPPPGAAQPSMPPEAPPIPRAGAYLPPSGFLTSVAERGAPALQAAPVVAAAAPLAPAGDETHAPSLRARLASQMPQMEVTLPPQVVAVGAGVTGLGFLLPWAAVVIGSGRIGGYLDQWGLAGPGHLLVLAVVVGVGVAAAQVDRLPDWVRPRLSAVAVGAFLVGLLWPYLFGSLQPSIGIYVTLVGAVLVVVGGLLDLWAARHAEDSPVV